MNLTNEQLALGVVLASCADSSPPSWLLDMAHNGLGGVTLFGANVATAELAHRFVGVLRAVRPSVLIAIDEEGGTVSRFDASVGGRTPGNAALGNIDDVATTAKVSSIIARRLAAIGVDLNFAPVADVNVEAASRGIGVRSFSSDPHVVARHVDAAVEASAPHLASCVKHFPGHGSVVEDSHHELPLVDLSRRELDEVNLVPFVAAINAGVDCVMLAHLEVPSLGTSPTSQSPETVSLLRDELGFDGVIVSDALDMNAVGSADAIGAAAVASLRAGVDLLCLGADLRADQVRRAIDDVIAAIRSGELDRSQLALSHRRIETMRLRLAAVRPVDVMLDGGSSISLGRYPISDETWLSIAQQAMTVEGAYSGTRPLCLIECRPPASPAAADMQVDFGAFVRELVPRVESTMVVNNANEALSIVIDDQDVVVAIHSLDAHPWQRDLIERVTARGRCAGFIELGWPSPNPPLTPLSITTHGASAPSCRAAGLALADLTS